MGADRSCPGVTEFRLRRRGSGSTAGAGCIETDVGLVGFECAPWYDDAALAELRRRGGLQVLASSHVHGYGALWQVQEQLDPPVVAVGVRDLLWTKAFRVTWPADDVLELAPGLTLHRTGGHFDGHSVLHDARRGVLFCGDSLKVDLGPSRRGRSRCRRTRRSTRRSRCRTASCASTARSSRALEFDTVFTPFEGATGITTDHVLRLVDRLLSGPPSAGPVPLDELADAPTRALPRVVPRRPGRGVRRPRPRRARRAAAQRGDPRRPRPPRRQRPRLRRRRREAARTGALGEMAEMALSTRALAGLERPQASYAELVRERGRDRVQDPRTLCLEAGSAYDDDRPLQWLPMTRARDGEQVLVPAELVASAPEDLPGAPPPGGWLTTVITNGQGAGVRRPRPPSAHALLEVLQRDGNAVSFRAMDQGVVVDLDGLTDPDSLAAARPAARRRASTSSVKLASTEFGVVDVLRGRLLRRRAPCRSWRPRAARPPTPTARWRCARRCTSSPPPAPARRSCTARSTSSSGATPPGYLDGWLAGHPPERLVEEDRALQAMLAWSRQPAPRALVDLLQDSVLSRRSTVRLTDLPTGVAGRPARRPCVEPAARRRPRRARRACSRAHGEAVAAKVLVPGLEVETMSYGRIGERGVRRLLERGDPLVAVGARPAAASRRCT